MENNITSRDAVVAVEMRWLLARCSATWPSLHLLCLCVAALSPSLSTKVPPAARATPLRVPAPRQPLCLLRAGRTPVPLPLFRMDTQKRYVDKNTQTWSRSHNLMSQKCGSWRLASILKIPRYGTVPCSARRGRFRAAVMGKNTELHSRGSTNNYYGQTEKALNHLKLLTALLRMALHPTTSLNSPANLLWQDTAPGLYLLG